MGGAAEWELAEAAQRAGLVRGVAARFVDGGGRDHFDVDAARGFVGYAPGTTDFVERGL